MEGKEKALGAFHKLRLQLGWVGSQQNANQCKLRDIGPFENVYVYKKSYYFTFSHWLFREFASTFFNTLKTDDKKDTTSR